MADGKESRLLPVYFLINLLCKNISKHIIHLNRSQDKVAIEGKLIHEFKKSMNRN